MDLNLSLRTWPDPDPDDTAVSSLISRIQRQRGHFKTLSESQLEAEIAAASSQPASPSDDDDDDKELAGLTPDETSKETTPADAFLQAKHEMLELLAHANNEALLALDYVSLVTSLGNKELGLSTMSPALKAEAPPGCVGFDRITRKVDKKAVEEEQKIAKEWKRQGLASAADALLKASEKLGAEVEKETRYWSEVLAIRNDGWLITRMPRERNVLGVRYGFAESAKEYKDKGIGALRRNDDGSVRMDDMNTGTRARAMLRVRVLKNGEVVGTSTQHSVPNDGSVKDMIRRARNFIYEDELFFELMKEARHCAAHGMRTSEDAAMIELGKGRMIVLDMAPLDDDTSRPSSPDDNLAQAIALSLRILLSYNHRLALKARSKPPPPLSARKLPRPQLQLLRPVTNHLHHHTHLQHLQTTLAKLRAFAVTAGLPASYTITPFSNTLGKQITDVDSAVETFLHVLETEAAVSLPGGWSLAVTMRSRLHRPVWGTQYVVTTAHDGVAARLMGEQRFATMEEFESYLYWSLERSVVNFVRLLEDGWTQEALGNEMKRSGKRVRIEVDQVGLAVTWGSAGGRDEKAVWDGTEKGRGVRELLEGI